jgi:CubicO group peptidase (beta-lactamase class C family)
LYANSNLNHMKKIVALFIIMLLAFLWISGNGYLWRALYYNFVNIDDYKIFANATLKHHKSLPWPKSITFTNHSNDTAFNNAWQQYETTALVVIKNDSLVFEQYAQGTTSQTVSGSFSVAKSIVSILIGIALKEGHIKSIDEPVANYLPSFNTPSKKEITIKHLLTMSAGLKWDEAYSSLFSVTTKAYYGYNVAELVSNLQPETKPGLVFNYQSCNTQLLGMVLTKATGTSLSAYAQKKLWQPIQAEHDALWSLDNDNGIEKCFCCFNSTATDFARIGALYLHMGNWHGQQIVDTAFVIQSTQPAALMYMQKPNTIYGMHWWLINDNNQPMYFARGILGQYIFVMPHKNLVAVRLGKKRGEVLPDGYVSDIAMYINWLSLNY